MCSTCVHSNCTDTVAAGSTSVSTDMNPDRSYGAGFFRVEEPSLAGSPVLSLEGIYSQITASEAAQLCGVKLCTITKWVREERLIPCGLNEQGRKLYRLLDVAKAEQATRERARR